MPFSTEQAERICRAIAEEGLTLRKVAQREGISAALIVKNAIQDPEGFGKQYARAIDDRTDNDFEHLVDFALVEPERTKTGIDAAWVNLRRLQVDTIKWALSKRNPKKYGERMNVDAQVDVSLADTVREMRQRLSDEKE